MRHLLALSLVVSAISLGGCSGGSSGATLGTDPTNALPPIKVDLPPQPSFAPPDIPLKTPEGDFSIYGLRKDKKNQIGKEVKVKAYLLEVYQCPVCPKGQTCKACDQPNFLMGDKPDTKKEKALMVVDYLSPKQKPPVLTIGKQYEVAGQFNISSPTGFGSSDGLLVFTEMTDDKNVKFESQAQKLQEKALAGEGGKGAMNGEAIEAEMAKKRAAAMKK